MSLSETLDSTRRAGGGKVTERRRREDLPDLGDRSRLGHRSMQVGPPIRCSRDRLETRRPAAPPVSTSSSSIDRMQRTSSASYGRGLCAEGAVQAGVRGASEGFCVEKGVVIWKKGERRLGKKEDLQGTGGWPE
ncbi:hypothetical protein ACG7TL_004551 [Trametes sanguinea]